jgi:hypothetical protein
MTTITSLTVFSIEAAKAKSMKKGQENDGRLEVSFSIWFGSGISHVGNKRALKTDYVVFIIQYWKCQSVFGQKNGQACQFHLCRSRRSFGRRHRGLQ